MRFIECCGVASITLIGTVSSFFLLVSSLHRVDLFETPLFPSPYTPLVPWFIFAPTKVFQDVLYDFIQATTPPYYQVMDLATSYWKSEVTYALAKNGIADALDDNPGVSCEKVAQLLELNEHVVCEYMRAGAYLGLLKEKAIGQEQYVYSLTRAGRMLGSNVPGSVKDYVLYLQEEINPAWRAAGTKSIKTGQSGFKEAFGEEMWEHHNQFPEKSALFDRGMQATTPANMHSILADWAPANKTGVICDIGGGLGTAVQLILEQHPGLTAIILDQPETAARANEQLKDNDRIKAVGGSFFEDFPSELEQCDTFFLKWILHDWPDEESLQILRNIKQVAKPNSELAIAELAIGDTGGRGRFEMVKRLISITMLATCKFGAKERTLSQFQTLMDEAGLGQNCDTNGHCNNGKLEEIRTRDIGSVLTLKL